MLLVTFVLSLSVIVIGLKRSLTENELKKQKQEKEGDYMDS